MTTKRKKSAQSKPYQLASDPLNELKHEAFALAIAKGVKIGPAFQESGYKAASIRIAQNGGNRLLRDEAIAKRIAYLRSKAAARVGISVETLCAEADSVKALALSDRDYSTASRCIELKARLTGHMVADRANKRPAIQEVSEKELIEELHRLNQTQERADKRLVH